jgi:diguanylate cyclase (GGDEF)-like protein
MHYPINEAGVWAEGIRQGKPVIHNDYQSIEHKKGLPEGHPALTRELVFPVYQGGQIVAALGVGNKPVDYDQKDIDLVSQVVEMTRDFIERKRNEQKIAFMAYNDILTGLPNRELLADRLKQARSQSSRSGDLLAVCYLDLDGFKPVNDQFGHHVGDQLLIELAKRLSGDLRQGDTLARLGGDEFVILLCDLSDVYQGEEIISRLLKTIQQPFNLEQHRILVSGSIGVTLFPFDDVDADTLIRHADQAMFRAKASGKANYQLYDTVQDEKVHVHREQLREFASALRNNQLRLAYQPKVDLSNGTVIGFEALVRWQHPKKGLLPPHEFLPLIEGSPEEIALGEWVLKTALDQHMAWRHKLGKPYPVSVNISPRHLQMSDFVDHLQEVLTHYPEDTANNLELEVLETMAIDDSEETTQVMHRCAALGVHFSLDDFGTGYSSLTHFHRLPIDVLKIDQNFVRNILDNPRDIDIVEGVLRLAEALERPVVAEGVESVEIGMVLLQLGCHYAQGYGIARPMWAEDVGNWLQQWQKHSIWHSLPTEAGGIAEQYDLNVSIISHRRWTQQLVDALQNDDLDQLPPLDAGVCNLGRWHSGIGRMRYGYHPGFELIAPQHNQLHQLATGMVADYRGGDHEQVKQQITVLEAESDKLIALLQNLSND